VGKAEGHQKIERNTEKQREEPGTNSKEKEGKAHDQRSQGKRSSQRIGVFYFFCLFSFSFSNVLY